MSLASAVAASTSTVRVGTWVLSALHRNPGLTAKVAATLDEISDGRFIFGLGAGHAGSQGKAFGFPEDRTVGRFEEALQIIVPLTRGEEVSFDGQFHSAFELRNSPNGPSNNTVQLMLAGHGPRTIGLAVRYGDIWSAYATASSRPEAFKDMLKLVDATCSEQGRDPSTLKRSIGVTLEMPGSPASAEDVGLGVPLRGSVDEVAESVADFRAMGVDMVEVMPFPSADEGLEFMGAVSAALAASE